MIWTYPETIDEVSEILKPDDFVCERNADRYKYFCDKYYKENRTLDLTEIQIEKSEMVADLLEAYANRMGVDTPSFAKKYAKKILRGKMNTKLRKIAEEMLTESEKDEYEPEQIASHYVSRIAEIDSQIGEKSSAKDLLKEYRKESEEMSKKQYIGMNTGIRKLDELTQGIIRGTVMMISAYTNTGKSAFAYWITKNLLENGHKGLFFSTEVQKTHIVARLLSSMSGSPYWDVFKKKVDITSFEKKFESFDFHIYDTKNNIDQISTIVSKLEPEFIVIDFVQNLDIDKYKDEYRQMTAVAIKMQQLAITKNTAILALSQISNEGAKQKKSDIIYSKGSGALAASSDVNIELTKVENMMNVNIKKNKFGPKGDFDLRVDLAKSKFQELQPSNNQYHL